MENKNGEAYYNKLRRWGVRTLGETPDRSSTYEREGVNRIESSKASGGKMSTDRAEARHADIRTEKEGRVKLK